MKTKIPKKGIKLNLGCGVYIPKGWISVDNFFTEEDIKSGKGSFKNAIWEKGGKFVKADILKMPFPDNYADFVLMDNVIEHLPFRTLIPTMIEVYRVMKKGATLRIITNSMDGIALDWLDMAREKGTFDLERYMDITQQIYGNQTSGGEFHTVPFNPDFMNYVLVQAGFKEGVITKVPRHTNYPQLGVVKIKKGLVTRNEVLWAEMTK